MNDILVKLRDQLKPQGELRPLCLEAAAEIERLRAALELIAGSATDKLQAMQARNALDNIGASQQRAETSK